MTSQPPVTLRDPLQPSTERTIADVFWAAIPKQIAEAYWKFFTDECRRALQNNGQHVLAHTHQDILDIVVSLKANVSRDVVRARLRPKFTRKHPNELSLMDRSIDLAASLLLMMDFGHIQHGLSGRQRLHWIDGTLKDCVRLGVESSPCLGHEGIRLQRSFTVLSLVRIAGLEIVPTTNLLDHLRLLQDDKKLYIFHHASFLKVQTPEYVSTDLFCMTQTNVQSSLLPQDFVRETLNTLALLFPQSDSAVRKWYSRLPAPFALDPEIMRCGYLKTDDRQIEKFVYWHDRMVMLKQVYDEATPQTLSQWWYDRRNSVQWYTFWVAIMVLALTIIFGFIQSVTGIMQVYAAFNQRSGV